MTFVIFDSRNLFKRVVLCRKYVVGKILNDLGDYLEMNDKGILVFSTSTTSGDTTTGEMKLRSLRGRQVLNVKKRVKR